MTPEFAQAARSLIAAPSGDADDSHQATERAVHACERLANHLSRLIGEAGVQLLLKRSIVRTGKQFSWLAAGPPSESTLLGLRKAMEQQDPETIADAFVAMLVTFVGLLERLIGEGLVTRLLEEVWPTVFANAAKDIQ